MKKIFSTENLVTFGFVFVACGLAVVIFPGIWATIQSQVSGATSANATAATATTATNTTPATAQAT